jgi:solute:Na+ symporter, SSS family
MVISGYDLAVIVCYFVFLISIGWITRRYVATTSDYFRGSGQMLWWMTGATAFMTQFSAWSFTGGASKAYTDGPVILTIFLANALGFFISYLYFAPKLRQLRVITPVEAVRQRYGKGNEQFFTWIFIPTNILYAGIWLNGLAVFLSAVFGFSLQGTILCTGLVVIFYATTGGSWAVVTSDFMQTLLLMVIAVVTAGYALVAVGGPVEMVTAFPAKNIVLGNSYNYPLLIIGWMIFIFFKQFVSTNNIMEASRYLTAKDSNNARKAALMASMLMLFGPVIWFIPPMAARILYPDIGAMFPQLGNKATEASYVAIALSKLPTGMMGLLIAGMFAATISSMDSGLNRNAGIFVKNFYLSVLNPQASEKKQMLISKLMTVLLGFLVIGAALYYTTLEDFGLFDLMLQFSSLIGLPVTIPLVLMLLVKRTPDWAGWSTVVLGLGLSLIVKTVVSGSQLSARFGWDFTTREISEFDTMLGIACGVIVLPLWFVSTKLFYRPPSAARAAEQDAYWQNLNRPAIASENSGNSDGRQGKVLGTLAALYGGLMFVLFLIPNPLSGRLVFAACGAGLLLLGWVLYRSTNPRQRLLPDTTEPCASPKQPPLSD